MNKRPREDEFDDAALLSSVKKPHTDFSDLFSDKSSSTLDKNSTPDKAKPEGNIPSKCILWKIIIMANIIIELEITSLHFSYDLCLL